jgi:hypothetical protein
LVRLCIVDFQSSEHGVFEANIDANNVMDDRRASMSLQGGRNGEIGGGITVENVHELGFFYCGNHDGASLGVGSQVLSRDNPSCARLPKRFLMNFDETAGARVIIQDHNTTRI